MKEASLYRRLEDGKVQCFTCSHGCTIPAGGRGICGVRENRSGTLMSLVYGKAVALHVDPIEKKPLFHFHPGTRSFSMASAGCNMRCLHCQNADISQSPRESGRIDGSDASPGKIVSAALHHRCHSISYTYTEPAVYWDYAFDTARLAREKGLKNVFVTNGYYSEESLDAVAPFMDAANVDVKAFREETYREVCGARLEPVLETIRRMKARGIWIEVTTLLIPGLNDSEEELEAIARFVHGVDPGIPWHVSRFHPGYRMTDRPPTPVDTIKRALAVGDRVGLRYVYAGNVPGEERESTFCHQCRARLIHRWGFEVAGRRIVDGGCPECGTAADGVW